MKQGVPALVDGSIAQYDGMRFRLRTWRWIRSTVLTSTWSKRNLAGTCAELKDRRSG